MRSVSWVALLVPLLFSSLPAAARERPVERVSRMRTVHASTAVGGALPELSVAGGSATVITTDVPLGIGGPVLQDEGGRVRLVPVDATSFILLPSSDLPEGERLVLTVPLPPGDSLQLALVTRRGEVDGEVRLVRLQAPVAGQEGVSDVARLLQAASVAQVGLAPPKTWVRLRAGIHAEVESVLRIGPHVFITLSSRPVWDGNPSVRDWERLQLRASRGDGSTLVLPLLHVPSSSGDAVSRHTVVATPPGGTAHLLLGVKGSSLPETILALP
ncbi:DUF2381 family protein [Archangium violaceum]|uniref:Uncharacterized protein n=1 Tax=Archangium violaceum Cb vi76 TaxID=1406225 RepID=A0A084SEP4_9BACT|nr:DUF2381 family protein [Archangium violaceum]KFA86929.1 hypothetical protein Q664_52110 [Archangium violaceum Cb vi76]